jgi:4-hydroxy-2-oxoglutarate aldolase
MPGKSLHLDGISIPITTPFDADGAVDLEGLKKNIELYNGYALTGYVAGGSTGESAFLAKDEKLKIWETLKATAAPGRTLVAGAAYESVRETIKMVKAAAEIGFDAALLLSPHYYRALMTKPESQLAYYRAVADASKIPLIIYNFPQITGLDVSADTVAELATHPNIAAIKESSGDLVKVKALMDQVPAHFQVTVGAAGKYFASLELGVRGGILAIGDIIPAAAIELHNLYRAGDRAAAGALQDAIMDVCNLPPTYGIPGIKYAMDWKGFVGGQARLPLLPLAEEAKPKIAAMLQAVETRAAVTVG